MKVKAVKVNRAHYFLTDPRKTMQDLMHVANLTLWKKTVFEIVHCIKYNMICTSGYFRETKKTEIDQESEQVKTT